MPASESPLAPHSPRARLRAAAGVRSARYGYHQMEDEVLCFLGLTESERQLAHLMLQGLTYAQIASVLHLSASTVKAVARRIFQKAGVGDRGSFERLARRLVEAL